MIPKQLVWFVVPVIFGILWFLLQGYIDREIENQQLKNETQIEETIKDAVKESKEANPTNNPSISLDRLRESLSNWD